MIKLASKGRLKKYFSKCQE